MTTNTTNPASSRLDGSTPNVETVRALIAEHNNWGRWGADDQVGTLNHVAPTDLVRAASTIRSGKRFSLALPFDFDGPQRGGFGRVQPIHLMFRDGGDIVAGTIVDDFYGGNDRYCRGTDDLVIMPLQSGTQWDALSHIIFDGTMYNGYSPTNVASKGASATISRRRPTEIAGRGVLLDLARAKSVDALEPGYAITADHLNACASAQGCASSAVKPGCVRSQTRRLLLCTAWDSRWPPTPPQYSESRFEPTLRRCESSADAESAESEGVARSPATPSLTSRAPILTRSFTKRAERTAGRTGGQDSGKW